MVNGLYGLYGLYDKSMAGEKWPEPLAQVLFYSAILGKNRQCSLVIVFIGNCK